MKKLNKYIIGMGTVVTIASPVVLAVSCNGAWQQLDTKALDDFMKTMQTQHGDDFDVIQPGKYPAIDKDFKDLTPAELAQLGLSGFDPLSLGAPLDAVIHVTAPKTSGLSSESERPVTFTIFDASGIQSVIAPVTIHIPMNPAPIKSPETLLGEEQTRVNTALASGITMDQTNFNLATSQGTAITAANKADFGLSGLSLTQGYTYLLKEVSGSTDKVIVVVTHGSTVSPVTPTEITVTFNTVAPVQPAGGTNTGPTQTESDDAFTSTSLTGFSAADTDLRQGLVIDQTFATAHGMGTLTPGFVYTIETLTITDGTDDTVHDTADFTVKTTNTQNQIVSTDSFTNVQLTSMGSAPVVAQQTPADLLDAEQTRVNTALATGISMLSTDFTSITSTGIVLDDTNKGTYGLSSLVLDTDYVYTIKPGAANNQIIVEVTKTGVTGRVAPANIGVTQTTALPTQTDVNDAQTALPQTLSGVTAVDTDIQNAVIDQALATKLGLGTLDSRFVYTMSGSSVTEGADSATHDTADFAITVSCANPSLTAGTPTVYTGVTLASFGTGQTPQQILDAAIAAITAPTGVQTAVVADITGTTGTPQDVDATLAGKLGIDISGLAAAGQTLQIVGIGTPTSDVYPITFRITDGTLNSVTRDINVTFAPVVTAAPFGQTDVDAYMSGILSANPSFTAIDKNPANYAVTDRTDPAFDPFATQDTPAVTNEELDTTVMTRFGIPTNVFDDPNYTYTYSHPAISPEDTSVVITITATHTSTGLSKSEDFTVNLKAFNPITEEYNRIMGVDINDPSIHANVGGVDYIIVSPQSPYRRVATSATSPWDGTGFEAIAKGITGTRASTGAGDPTSAIGLMRSSTSLNYNEMLGSGGANRGDVKRFSLPLRELFGAMGWGTWTSGDENTAEIASTILDFEHFHYQISVGIPLSMGSAHDGKVQIALSITPADGWGNVIIDNTIEARVRFSTYPTDFTQDSFLFFLV